MHNVTSCDEHGRVLWVALVTRLLQQGFCPVSNKTWKCCSRWELYNGAQSQVLSGNRCTNPSTCSETLRFDFCFIIMCNASYVVRRDKRMILATLHYIWSYDKVARSKIEATKSFLDLLIELWTNANRIQLELRLEQLTWLSSQEYQLFKTVPHAILGCILLSTY